MRNVEVFAGVEADCVEANDAAGESVGGGSAERDRDHGDDAVQLAACSPDEWGQ